MSANGQVWIDEGAVWHYDYSNIGYGGFYKYEYTGDTLIEGYNCQIISGRDYQFTSNQNGEIVLSGEYGLETRYTYVSGDTVFFWNKNEDKFFTLFDFGAEIGDTWTIANERPNNWVIDPDTDSDTSKIEVIETGTININSNNYRYIKIKPVYGSLYGFEGTYVERFGNIDSTLNVFQDLFPNFYDYSNSVMAEWNMYKLKCFQDNSFALYNPTDQEDCEYYLTHLGVDVFEMDKVKCYPNPTTEFLIIENPYSESIIADIYDINGRLIDNAEINSTSKIELDISNYENGIYFIKIKTNISNGKTIKIIKQ